MSLKPPKKSDLGKSWMKNRRDKARMIQPEYHLIASEVQKPSHSILAQFRKSSMLSTVTESS